MKSAAELKRELKAQGYRLPHGYDIVKRKPRKKKTAVGKPKAPNRKTVVSGIRPLTQSLSGKSTTHKAFKVGDKLVGGRIDHKTGKFTAHPQLKDCKVVRIFISSEKGHEGYLSIAVKSGNKTFVAEPFVKKTFSGGYALESLDSNSKLLYFQKK